MCNSTAMDDEVRRAYLDWHNNYRSSLAEGREYNGRIGYAPKASNMQVMTYDCIAEESARRHAKSCSGKLSDPDSRPGYKENIVHITKTYLNDVDTARKASDRWWKELSMHGVNAEMNFTSEARHRTSKIITHFAKMAWHDNVKLGCAHQNCGEVIFAVCHYGPGGNVVDELIYNQGEPCTRCPDGTSCNGTFALCA